METQNSYEFCTAPQLDNYLELEQTFEKTVRVKLRAANAAWCAGDTDVAGLAAQALEALKAAMPAGE